MTANSKSNPSKKPASRTALSARSKWTFPDDTIAFLSDLKANNNREWFTANKSRYEDSVKHPAAEFCEIMTGKLEALTGTPHVSKVFRVNRDIRFSKDKTPYKAYMHILFRTADDENAPKWFFGLEPDKLVLGTGIFAFEKRALDDFRRRVSGPDGDRLAKTLDKLRTGGARIREPELKRVPGGYPATIAYPELLRHKGLTAWCDHPGGPAAAARPDIVPTTVAALKTLKPLYDWLRAA